MRRIIIGGVVAMVVLMGSLPQIGEGMHKTEKNLDGVSISWEGGFGVQLVITNNNNYSIYNVSLDSISISGFVISSLWGNAGMTIAEMPPETSISFGSLMIGVGSVAIAAQISYDEQGEHVVREAIGNFFFLGLLVLPVQ